MRQSDIWLFPASTTFSPTYPQPMSSSFPSRYLIPNTKQIVTLVRSSQNARSARDRQMLEELEEGLRNLVTWDVEGLEIGQGILGRIWHVGFGKMRELVLKGVSSCQRLERLDMPTLEILNMDNNDLFQLRSLRKSNFPNLKTLSLKNNKILNPTSLSQQNTPNLTTIIMQNWHDPPQSLSIVWLCKIQAKNLALLRMFSRGRLAEGGVKERVRRRYGGKLIFQTHFD